MLSLSSSTARLIGVSAATLVVGFGGAIALVGHSASTRSAEQAAQQSAVSAQATHTMPDGSSMAGMSDMPGMQMQDGSNMQGMPGMNNGFALYAVQTGSLGIIVTDGGGRVLYGSNQDANNPPTSNCTGACADEWQPLVVPPGQPLDLEGVKADLVGHLKRGDGSDQLTIAGWPAYVNKSDTGELAEAAPGSHGAWFAMTPQGQKVPL